MWQRVLTGLLVGASMVTSGAAAAAITVVTHEPVRPASPKRRVTAAGSAPIEPAMLAVRDAHRNYVGDTRERHVARRAAARVMRTTNATFERLAERHAVKPEPPPPPEPAPEQPQAAPAAPTGSVWDRLAACESGGDWDARRGQYEGGLQFHPATWDRNKPSGYPDAAYQASREQQIVVGKRIQATQGWDAWPACARELGLS